MEINLEVKTMTFAHTDVFRNRPALKNFENFVEHFGRDLLGYICRSVG